MHEVAIVGASRGLGLALVGGWLEQGARVNAVVRAPELGAGYSAGTEQLEQLAAQHPDRLRIVSADVRSEAQLHEAATSLAREAPFLDVLIYNAAIHLETNRADLFQSDPDDVLSTLDVNAVGALRAVKHFRPLLREAGHLTLISSEAGSIAQCGRVSEYGYCMSKAALNMLGKLLSNRERKRGSSVRVSCIHPGWLRTDMGGPHADDPADEAARQLVALQLGANDDSRPMYTDRWGAALPW